MKRFEFNDGSSSKFWEIEQDGCDVHVRYGKIGTAGQAQTKSHADAAKAGAAMEKLVREKTGKGYAEAGAGTPVASAQ
ncbi:WGR domain-containing protein, partial [Massilia sp. CCM 8695]